MIRQYLAHVQADTSFLLKSDQQGKEDLINIECRVLACALSRSADIEAVLDDIFRPAKDTVTRSLHYKSIARAMRANISNAAAKKALETRLLAVVEQLSNFLAAVQSDDEAAAVLEMTRVLLQFEDESFHTRFERIIPRVCAAALALIAADKAQFGFLILQCVLSSNYRSFCQQSFSAIRNASFEYLCSPGACDLSADCAALTVIADTAENWIGYWKSYVFTGITLIQSMGIAMNVSLPKSSKPIREMALRSQSGAGKALFCERMLRGCFKGMERMLYHGCATGPVCTELSGLFICCQAVMAVHMDAFGNTDPKALIENESGVSMVDVSLVITNIKTYFLEFISTLLAVTPPTTLYPVAGYICRSVATAVSSKDFASSNRFSLAVLHSVSDVISAFPTAVIKV